MECTLRAIVVTVTIALATIAACRPRPSAGQTCQVANQIACEGSEKAWLCDASRWVEIRCRGGRGCVRRSGHDECDDSVAMLGDSCPKTSADHACSVDRSAALVCKEGAFALWRRCRGPEGCAVADGRGVQCDTSLGEKGDPCTQQGAYACSADYHVMLVCDGSVLVPASSCRGPKGCVAQRATHKVDCDDSVAAEGDPCDQPRRIACSIDRKAELGCTKGTYAKKRECRHDDCRIDGSELFCD